MRGGEGGKGESWGELQDRRNRDLQSRGVLLVFFFFPLPSNRGRVVGTRGKNRCRGKGGLKEGGMGSSYKAQAYALLWA